jgi:hypothetical protein
VGNASLWCRVENRTRACLTASRRATNWAMPPILSHAAPCWATPHHTEPCRTMLSHAAPCWATPHNTEPRHTINSWITNAFDFHCSRTNTFNFLHFFYSWVTNALVFLCSFAVSGTNTLVCLRSFYSLGTNKFVFPCYFHSRGKNVFLFLRFIPQKNSSSFSICSCNFFHTSSSSFWSWKCWNNFESDYEHL